MVRLSIALLVLLMSAGVAQAAPLGKARVKATWRGVLKRSKLSQKDHQWFVAPQLRAMAKMDRLQLFEEGGKLRLVAKSEKTGTTRSLEVDRSQREITGAETRRPSGENWHRSSFGNARSTQHTLPVTNAPAVMAQLAQKIAAGQAPLKPLHKGNNVAFLNRRSPHGNYGLVYVGEVSHFDTKSRAQWNYKFVGELAHGASPTLKQAK